MTFPRDFLWGAATSAFQIEGATTAGGRGESIWDRFCRTPGKVHAGDTGDRACEHYDRFEDDLDLMVELGLRTYRFSIAWPRIQPAGIGGPNPAGVGFYRRLLEGLHERGIVPMATLYHWDLPQALQDRGGWGARETVERFVDYAAIVAEQLGDLIPMFVTHNEPWVAAFLGHAFGVHAPGHEDWAEAVRASHHQMLSHGRAVPVIRSLAGPDTQVGIALNLVPAYHSGDSIADGAAARRMDGLQNRWFLDPVFRGEYPTDMVDEFERRLGPLDAVQPGDLAEIAAPIDFLGVNFYSCSRVRADPASDFFGLEVLPPQGKVTAMQWEVVPEGLRHLLERIQRDYGDVPVYITENGAAYDDAFDEDGEIDDPHRVQFLHDHIESLQQCLEQGINVRGYYAWSLLDNFEWAYGYDKRFGIVYVDWETQKRIPKSSAEYYRDVIARGGLPQ